MNSFGNTLLLLKFNFYERPKLEISLTYKSFFTYNFIIIYYLNLKYFLSHAYYYILWVIFYILETLLGKSSYSEVKKACLKDNVK